MTKRHIYELGKGYFCPVTEKYTNIVFTDPDSKGILNSCMECNPEGWDKNSAQGTQLGDISVEDAKAEGGHLYGDCDGGYSPEEYIEGVCAMYDNTIDENEVMWCYEFLLVKFCPTCNVQLDTYGQIWKCPSCEEEFGTVPLYVWQQVSRAEEVLS